MPLLWPSIAVLAALDLDGSHIAARKIEDPFWRTLPLGDDSLVESRLELEYLALAWGILCHEQ